TSLKPRSRRWFLTACYAGGRQSKTKQGKGLGIIGEVYKTSPKTTFKGGLQCPPHKKYGRGL
ncbi:MAG TPA: hypothetical protein DCP31_29190, partial [Cyanobacteria bacterium UBA8543]|nr:hypothetical protein [Cyanobacteria bacterium UBA8543]